MKSLYASPFRVYLFLGILGIVGIFSGSQLPISLFPKSSKPTIIVSSGYGSTTPNEFLNSYGDDFENQLRSINSESVQLETIQARYNSERVRYILEFRWGNSPVTALHEVERLASSFSGRLPVEIRESLRVFPAQENNGFVAISFFSAQRSFDELYEILEPKLMPQIAKISDVGEVELTNPTSKEITLELKPDRLAAFQLFPRDIENAVLSALSDHGGGSVILGTQQIGIQLRRPVKELKDLSTVVIPTISGRAIHLSDVARVDYGVATGNSSRFKTSGQPSLILEASPKPSGNVKKMSEDLIAIVEEVISSLPRDIQFRVIVDPSEFIRSSIGNVLHEVAIGAILAVVVLFLFIGSIKNTITAAIEIPLSMILAFILMKLSGMNLNLISLGGLAVSAGMNVDASVVVMENIFRHFEEHPGKLSFDQKLEIVIEAVREVRFAVIASTIASLIVFIPLAFTSDLSYAILGDLAKTVCFSHGFSAIVALILVPTVRLHLMKSGMEKPFISPIDRSIRSLEEAYGRGLSRFILSKHLKKYTYVGLVGILGLLLMFVLPSLPKELLGTPDTDWLVLSIRAKGHTLVRQMESQSDEVESELLREFGNKFQYTFLDVRDPNRSYLMARLRDPSEMRAVWEAMEKRFSSTPSLRFTVEPWNPAELPIPNPPQLRVAVRGGAVEDRAQAALDLLNVFQEKSVLPNLWTEPNLERAEGVVLQPNPEQWAVLSSQGARISPDDLADLARVATVGRPIGRMAENERMTEIFMRYPEDTVKDPESLGALPVGVNSRLIPFKALAQVKLEKLPPPIYREDGRDLFIVFGERNQSTGANGDRDYLKKATDAIEQWEKEQERKRESSDKPQQAGRVTVSLEDAEKDLTTAIRQLGWAVGLSVALVFLTLILQFGSVVNAALVLVAVPLGFLGVIISLFVFKSTLSLNSVLGVILLNGIAVANSIILVDFLKRLVDRGLAPEAAAVEAGKKRLRPILITSLTTILGMIPIALGLGEGGRILQPLGVAVSGGLLVSMVLTLFIVPALQVAYLNWQLKRGTTKESEAHLGKASGTIATALLVVAVGLCGSFSSSAKAADAGAPIQFSDALDKIVSRSISLQTQEARSSSTQAQNLPARLFYLPTLSLQASQENTQTGRVNNFNSNSLRQTVGTASLNIFKFGADVASYQAATQDQNAQRALTDATLLSVEQEAVEALTESIRRRRQFQIYEQLVGIQLELHRLAQRSYERGLLPRQEVEKVAIDLANVNSRLADAKIFEVQARGNLLSLLGSDHVEISWPWQEILTKQRFKAVLEDSAFNLEVRPDLRAAQAQLNAEDRRLSRAYRLLLPSIDASLSYGHYYPGGQESYPSWSGALILSLPLFDRLMNISNIRVQSYTRTIAELSVENVRRNALSEWEVIQRNFETIRQSALLREKTLKTARELFEDYQKRLRQGRISTNDLFVEQMRLMDTETLAIQAWADAHVAYSRLCHARARRIADCMQEASL